MSVTVLNMHHLKDKSVVDTDPSYVYIGRPRGGAPLGLGNPFKVGEGYARGEAVVAFKAYAREQWADKNSDFRKRVEALAQRVLAGEDIKLVCWCKPKACHGDVIKEGVEYLVTRLQEREQKKVTARPSRKTP